MAFAGIVSAAMAAWDRGEEWMSSGCDFHSSPRECYSAD
jgi:hypothetical protein